MRFGYHIRGISLEIYVFWLPYSKVTMTILSDVFRHKLSN